MQPNGPLQVLSIANRSTVGGNSSVTIRGPVDAPFDAFREPRRLGTFALAKKKHA